MNLSTILFRFLVFPGLLFAVPAAWFYLWVERKAMAKMQRRIGPPFMQPFFDFLKLMGKEVPARPGFSGFLMKMWPIFSVAAAAGACGLLPVIQSGAGFNGDLILLLSLLEVPSMFLIAAGFSSRSLWGEIGSAREATMNVAYNIVFLMAVIGIAVSQQTFSLQALAQSHGSVLRWIAVLAILVCLPAKLHMNPFSLTNAEQEIYAGPTTEYVGAELAMFELAHGLEWVAATGLVAVLMAPMIASPSAAAAVFVALSLLVVLVLTGIAAGTARLAIDSSVRFYGQCALILIVIGVSSALLMRMKL
jgi:NADH-quinone oxidoreductase subunit H